MPANLWTYGETVDGVDLLGFAVDARDGRVGTVTDTSDPGPASFLVVDPGPLDVGGPWLVSAAAIVAIEPENDLLRIDCSRDQVSNSPQLRRAA